jgi:thiamine-phosphate pyrophosphorylase
VKRSLPKLHAVTTNSILEHPDYAARARALSVSSEVALHIRSRRLGGRELFQVALLMQESTAETGTAIFVNDRADVARAAEVNGLHLPASGLPVAAARRILGVDRLIGCSTHSVTEAHAARDAGADYVFLGPIWRTPSHPDRPPLGPEIISQIDGIPVIAIGGVTPKLVAAAVEAGAYGVAAITSLWHAPDPNMVARRMLLSFHL